MNVVIPYPPSTEQREIIDVMASLLVERGQRSVRGVDLRQEMHQVAPEERRARVAKAVPQYLRSLGDEWADSYDLMPLGALHCKYRDRLLGLASSLQDLVVAKYNEEHDFREITWEEVQRHLLSSGHEVVVDDLELVNYAFYCVGVWGGSRDTWSHPLPDRLEDILNVHDTARLFLLVHNELLKASAAVRDFEARYAAAELGTEHLAVSASARATSAPADLLESAETLKSLLVARATGVTTGDDQEYRDLRKRLIQSTATKGLVPEFVRSCRDLSEFWDFIKHERTSYQERRAYLRNALEPLLTRLEQGEQLSSADLRTHDLLETFDWHGVQLGWEKCIARKIEDPDGAITAARTLLETVCKHILDECGVAYDDTWDLPKLYGNVAATLKLAPSQHTEGIFKQILGGCHSVVRGLGALRNRVGDAHGQGKQGPRPAARHAELAVNLAGAMATFLIQTWEKWPQDGLETPPTADTPRSGET